MDLLHNLVLSLVIVACSCIATAAASSSCSADRIRSCMTVMQQNGHSSKEPDCDAISRVKECFERETSACSESMRSTLTEAASIFDTYDNICRNPSSVSFDFVDKEECSQERLQECTEALGNQTHGKKNKEEVCSTLAEAKKCTTDMMKGCQSKFISSVLKSHTKLLQTVEEHCIQGGYTIRSNDTYQSLPADNDDDNCPSGPKCDCTRPQSAYYVTIIVALVAILRHLSF